MTSFDVPAVAEGPVHDLYSLSAAWDDENLYLMWQFTNVTDVTDPSQGYPTSDNGKPYNGGIPIAIALDVDRGVQRGHVHLGREGGERHLHRTLRRGGTRGGRTAPIRSGPRWASRPTTRQQRSPRPLARGSVGSGLEVLARPGADLLTATMPGRC
ncbi:hypothetical protein OG596_19695 [Streptomyces sp. NBC_01102]|uniref:hypothetical protein n=1 Tax=Streptomyces sp. NBC_01102 TaxID=2903749 RepID=UPI0038644AD8|nr:hypothetical protein OG596_19695 [Streptomyces sp. NBC_01102]